MKHTQLYDTRSVAFIFAAMLIMLFTTSNAVYAQERNKNDTSDTPPPFEFGVGGGALLMNSQPEWCSDYYLNAFGSFSWRLFAGFSIVGGKGVAGGGDIDEKWINVSKHNQLYTDDETTKYSTWAGARYTFDILEKPFNVIHADKVYIGGGITWEDINVRSRTHRYYHEPEGWELDDPQYETYNSKISKTVADLTGYYATVAGRWRLDTRKSAFSTTELGQYGIDAGFRYTLFNDHSLSHDSLEPADNLNYLQAFVMIYLKMGLFN